MSNHNRKHAVVIGASMAGLLTARVLADHFDEVTILERDVFPLPGKNRKGVPQGKHTHVLLERGRQVMERLLPGLSDELLRLGAARIDDASRNIRWFHSGGYHKPGTSDIAGLGVARPTLEALVRARVLEVANVRAIERCNVTGLSATTDNRHVTGVCFVDRGAGEDTILNADLVVDAGGRGSHGPAWLAELGYARPAEESVRIDMGYVTRHFRRQPDHIPGLSGIVLLATPPDRRLAVLLAQDGNRWVVTIGGYLGEHAPADSAGFSAAARALPAPEIYDVIANAEPLDEPVAYKFPANLRRHYEKLDRFPAGFLVIGDALCSFNPIYGQGMTVAALEAEALGDLLRGRGEVGAHAFFAAASKIIDLAWDAAVGNDLGYAEVEGDRTPLVRFFNWYGAMLHRAAHHDAEVSIAFLKVINMVAPPPTMLHPRILWRVLVGNLRSEEATRQSTRPSTPQSAP